MAVGPMAVICKITSPLRPPKVWALYRFGVIADRRFHSGPRPPKFREPKLIVRNETLLFEQR